MLSCKVANLPAGTLVVAYDPGATNAPDRGRLLAFIACSGPRDISTSSLRELKAKLAGEMGPSQLPSVLVPVEERFPLTTSGKVRGAGWPEFHVCTTAFVRLEASSDANVTAAFVRSHPCCDPYDRAFYRSIGKLF